MEKDDLIENTTSYADCAGSFSDHYTLLFTHTEVFFQPSVFNLYIKNINNHNKVFIFNRNLKFVVAFEIKINKNAFQ